MLLFSTFLVSLLISFTQARLTPVRRASATDITPAQITKISPETASCDPSGQFGSECRTATQAAPFVNKAFQQFGITTKGEKAALLSLMLFETGGFKFDKNHFPPPGNPGQGTRNLMNFPFILKYALNTTSTASQAKSLAPNANSASADTKNKVLALMLPDNLSFASAAWFLKNSGEQGCADVEQGLKSGSLDGWKSYITKCVGTTVTSDRQSIYEAALAAL